MPTEPGVHRLFPGIPLTLTAEAGPGFRFVRWNGTAGDLATTATTTRVLTGTTTLTAEFAPSEERMIGGILQATTSLVAGATYSLNADLIIPPGLALNVPAGITLNMPAGRHLRVQGALNVEGSAAAPVRILGRDGARWGGISFENPDAPSALRHLVIRQATRGANPVVYPRRSLDSTPPCSSNTWISIAATARSFAAVAPSSCVTADSTRPTPATAST